MLDTRERVLRAAVTRVADNAAYLNMRLILSYATVYTGDVSGVERFFERDAQYSLYINNFMASQVACAIFATKIPCEEVETQWLSDYLVTFDGRASEHFAFRTTSYRWGDLPRGDLPLEINFVELSTGVPLDFRCHDKRAWSSSFVTLYPGSEFLLWRIGQDGFELLSVFDAVMAGEAHFKNFSVKRLNSYPSNIGAYSLPQVSPSRTPSWLVTHQGIHYLVNIYDVGRSFDETFDQICSSPNSVAEKRSIRLVKLSQFQNDYLLRYAASK